LPSSTDEYWEHAETNNIEIKKSKECDHFFVHKTAKEIECRHCGIGYFLSPGWYIKKGKMYTDSGELVG